MNLFRPIYVFSYVFTVVRLFNYVFNDINIYLMI